MNIALVYNVRHAKPDINNPEYILEAEFDEPSTIKGIALGLRQLGHRVFLIEADIDAYLKLKKLKKQINLVFNISEGLRGRDREAQIPAILEVLEIPYTGPSPLSYAIGLNKTKAKEIFKASSIATPRWLEVADSKDLKPKDINFFPAIGKPVGEGSSKGIQASNLAENFAQLQKIVRRLLLDFKQRVLIEEYLTGQEFTVAVIGNPPRVLPIIEVTFDALPAGMPHFDHYEAKWIYDNPESHADPLICPAKISSHLKKDIQDLSLRAFNALSMADWARLDIRLNKQGRPYIIEINCPPGIIPDPKENSRFPRACRAAGLNYNQMLEMILKSACRRYGIKYFKNN